MKDHVEGAKLADSYTELCKGAVGYMKAMEEYNPALMNAVGKWLKDNNITVDSRSGTPMDSLANDFKTLPFSEQQDETPRDTTASAGL
jgi:hypothetical protein